MSEPQPIIPVTADALIARVRTYCDQGWRLVQIGAATLKEGYELNYSFDRDGVFENLRLMLPLEAPRVPSISSIFWCAFIYENEISDLFGIAVDGNVLDFKGKFFQTAVKVPFAAPEPTPAAPTVPVAPATTTAPVPTTAATSPN
jgi:ech hydrogenase subunit D